MIADDGRTRLGNRGMVWKGIHPPPGEQFPPRPDMRKKLLMKRATGKVSFREIQVSVITGK